jgi:hypothetical protein
MQKSKNADAFDNKESYFGSNEILFPESLA